MHVDTGRIYPCRDLRRVVQGPRARSSRVILTAIGRKGPVPASWPDPGASATMAETIVEALSASFYLPLSSCGARRSPEPAWRGPRHGVRADPAAAASVGAGVACATADAMTAMGEGLAVRLKLRTDGSSRSRDPAAGSLKRTAQGNRVRGFPCYKMSQAGLRRQAGGGPTLPRSG